MKERSIKCVIKIQIEIFNWTRNMQYTIIFNFKYDSTVFFPQNFSLSNTFFSELFKAFFSIYFQWTKSCSRCRDKMYIFMGFVYSLVAIKSNKLVDFCVFCPRSRYFICYYMRRKPLNSCKYCFLNLHLTRLLKVFTW